LAEFYVRRGRRILPALFVVSIVAAVVAAALLQPWDLDKFGKYLTATPVFLSNIPPWLGGGYYFDSRTAPVALTHYWSIAVEEQFYLAYPLTLYLIGRYLPRRESAALGTLAAASFAVCVWASYRVPQANYFLAPSRAWELLLGAALATCEWRWTRHRIANELLSILARHVPNEARIEMIRISRDREAQREVAQSLVKSTAAVCTAIGMQPIPLADLPILTTLQLVMVSGIMYVSGRERSLRAATEFIGALGANVGAGMLLREGARALLKFFPGWGNVICGMVAGAGTYAIGRAAIVFFLEGVSLKDARRIYLSSRKRPVQPALAAPGQSQKTGKRKK